MPLHVSDAPHRLDLRNLGTKLIVVLELALLKQVLVASVSRVLVAHPAGRPQSRKETSETGGSRRKSAETGRWGKDLRATLDPNRRDLLLVAVCVEAGDVVVNDLDLLAGEAGVLVQDDLGLLAVLKVEEPGGLRCVRVTGFGCIPSPITQNRNDMSIKITYPYGGVSLECHGNTQVIKKGC